jgi:hypothetical protein
MHAGLPQSGIFYDLRPICDLTPPLFEDHSSQMREFVFLASTLIVNKTHFNQALHGIWKHPSVLSQSAPAGLSGTLTFTKADYFTHANAIVPSPMPSAMMKIPLLTSTKKQSSFLLLLHLG